MKFLTPIFRLHFVVLLWGFSGVLGKLISVGALPLVWWRMLIATAVVGGFIFYRKTSFKLAQKDVFTLLGIGVILGLHWFCFFQAIKVSNVSVALSTIGACAFFGAFLEPLFYKRKIYFYEVGLAFLVAVCILVIFYHEDHFQEGIIYGLISAFLGVLFSIWNAQLQVRIRPKKIIFYEMLGGVFTISVLLLYMNQSNAIFTLQWMDAFWLLILGVVVTAFPMIESVDLMKHLSPYTLLLTLNLEPIYGIALSYLIFGESEKMSALFYLCTLVMIIAIVLNGKLKKRGMKL